MTLRQLIDGLAGARVIGDASVEVRAVHDDSRKVGTGDVFVAVKGLRSDGHAFVADRDRARRRGDRRRARAAERARSRRSSCRRRRRRSACWSRRVARRSGEGDDARSASPARTARRRRRTSSRRSSRAAGHEPGVIGTVEHRWAGKSDRRAVHDADAAAAARDVRGDARGRLHARRDGGDVDRARPGPRSPGMHVRGRRVLEPHAGPPRHPRLDGGVPRREARGCSAST